MKITGQLAEKGIHAFDHEPRTQAGQKIPRLWCIVADSEKAHVFRKTTKGVECIAHARVHHDSAGAPHHGHDPHGKKRAHGDTAFIRKLTDWLDTAAQEDAFDRLILIAGPRTLGDMRASLGKTAHARVTAEVDRDLARLPENEIEGHLCEIVWF